MIQLPAVSRTAATWTYRSLWLLAMLFTLAIPLIILSRGDVQLGSVTFDAANRPSHPLVVIDGDVVLRESMDYPLIVLDGNAYVDGVLHDDLIAVAGNVFLTGRSTVGGNLVVVGGDVYRAPGAVVQGTIGATVNKWTIGQPTQRALDRLDLFSYVRLGLAFGFALLLLCLVVATALPWAVVITAATTRRYPIRSGLAGATGLIAVPFLLLPLGLSLVGLPLAMLLSLGALTVWLVGLAAAGFLIGQRVLGNQRQRTSFLREVIVGLAPILLFLAIPVVGPLLVGLVGVLGAGGRIVSFVERERAVEAMDEIAPAR
ncbi:MAG TPA: hypothetical protein VMW65_14030 [Chloroflexota bacterium]|nr:hypothetical protein [Chloroflexota bacterium]